MAKGDSFSAFRRKKEAERLAKRGRGEKSSVDMSKEDVEAAKRKYKPRISRRDDWRG